MSDFQLAQRIFFLPNCMTEAHGKEMNLQSCWTATVKCYSLFCLPQQPKMTIKWGVLLGVSKCFVTLDMPIDGLKNTQDLQVMQYRSANFPGEELGTYHWGSYRLWIPHFLLLTLISIMLFFVVFLLLLFGLVSVNFKANKKIPKKQPTNCKRTSSY